MRNTRVFGLLWHHLSHSFSADYFNNKFEREGFDCVYRNYDMPKIKDFPKIIEDNPDLHGLSVTSPYKEEIIQYLDILEGDAKEIGAVNTIKIMKDKTLHGYNTDISGFENLLREATSGREIQEAVIFGSGGASKAVQFVLKKNDIPYYIISRKPKNDFISYEEINKTGFKDNSLIINATPVGLYPNYNEHLPLNFDLINKSHIVIDLNYNPIETFLLKEAKKHGAYSYNGLKMLHGQAEASWKIWNQ